MLEEYLLGCSIRNFSQSTITNKNWIVRKFVRVTGITDIRDVKPLHMKQYIQVMQKHMKANSINTDLIRLNAFWTWAVEEDIIKENPSSKIKLLKREQLAIKTFTDEDVRKLIGFYKGKQYLDVRNKTLIILFLETGVRKSEAQNLIFDDAIRIRGKGNKVRFVPISIHLKKQMLKYERARKAYMKKHDNPYYFVTKYRIQMGRMALVKIMRKIADNEKLSISPTPHMFRRYYAQKMLDHTDLYTVSRLLGHTDIQTTQLYVNGTQDEKILQRGMNSPLSNL